MNTAATTSTPARIVVELTRGAVPIRGQLHARGHESRPFSGWTGLFAAMRALAGDDVPPAVEKARRIDAAAHREESKCEEQR